MEFLIRKPPVVKMPIVPRIEPDETLQSYLYRLSEANVTSITDAAIRLGITYKTKEIAQLYFVRPYKHQPDELKEFLAPTYFTALDPSANRLLAGRQVWEFTFRAQLRVGHSLICPECLDEGPAYWRLRWRRFFAFMCLKHNRLLSYRCPSCELLHCQGRHDGSVVPAHPKLIATTTRCLNPSPIGSERARRKLPCGNDLTKIRTAEIEAAELIEAQRLLAAVIDGSVNLLPFHSSARLFLADLWFLCAQVLFAGTPKMANGLGTDIRKQWESFCRNRQRRLQEMGGKRGSADHPLSQVPSPLTVAIAVRQVLPILLAQSEVEFLDRLRSLMQLVNRRAPKGLQRARANKEISKHLRWGLVEVTIKDNQVLAYVRNRRVKGFRIDRREAEARVTPELVREYLPEVCSYVKVEEVVPPLKLMVRFHLISTASSWSDVIQKKDPANITSKVLRLVNVAGKAGVSRKLARLVVDIARGYIEVEDLPPQDTKLA